MASSYSIAPALKCDAGSNRLVPRRANSTSEPRRILDDEDDCDGAGRFELLEGQARNVADTALIGGVSALKLAIERGVTGTGQTGAKPGTVQAKIAERQIT
jgi:hypothetical protein